MAEGHDGAGEFRDGMPFVGGRLWVDLLNTVMQDGAMRSDVIATEAGMAAWLAAADLERPSDIGATAGDLLDLRECLRPAVDLIRTGSPLPAGLVEQVNARLDEIAIRLHLDLADGQPRLASRMDSGSAGPSGPIAADFARFVCEAEPGRLKHCANPGCSLVFYDQGKNNIRRWCSMTVCGNRDKVARYRAKRRDGATV